MAAESVMQVYPRRGVAGSVWGNPGDRLPTRIVIRSPGARRRILVRRVGVHRRTPNARNAPVPARRPAPPTQPLCSPFRGPHASASGAGPIWGLPGIAGTLSGSNEGHRRAMTWAAMARGEIRIGNVVGYGDHGTRFKIDFGRRWKPRYLYSFRGARFESREMAEAILAHVHMEVAKGRALDDVLSELAPHQSATSGVDQLLERWLDLFRRRVRAGDRQPRTLRDYERWARPAGEPGAHFATGTGSRSGRSTRRGSRSGRTGWPTRASVPRPVAMFSPVSTRFWPG